jgi:hypothetical protein
MSARPIADPAEIVRRYPLVLATKELKRRYRFDRVTGVWVGWRAGSPELDELVGDYHFVYADTDGYACGQVLSHEFVSAYPAYLPDGDWPSTVEQWWLGQVLKMKADWQSPTVDVAPDPLLSEVRTDGEGRHW